MKFTKNEMLAIERITDAEHLVDEALELALRSGVRKDEFWYRVQDSVVLKRPDTGTLTAVLTELLEDHREVE